ncbi:SAV_6107 family HEPN domain-containing protein [Rhodococcus kronopolitis]|uniref:SAV_6107 family HEPN domain-containing protein n=1 Tax=Rhodococcus kronopolitis TaxID=1460226 RepID=A0ABV9FMA7_9NOCA
MDGRHANGRQVCGGELRDRGGAGRGGLRPPPISPLARGLLDRADALLAEAAAAPDPGERFRSAYLAALRGAGAALGGPGHRVRPGSRSAWVQLARAESGLADWAEFFAGYSQTRAAIEAGISGTLTWADADRFHREVSRFLTAVEDLLGGGSRVDEAADPAARRSA